MFSKGASIAGRALLRLPVDCIGVTVHSNNTDACKNKDRLMEAIQVFVKTFLSPPLHPWIRTSVLVGWFTQSVYLSFHVLTQCKNTTFTLDDGTGAHITGCHRNNRSLSSKRQTFTGDLNWEVYPFCEYNTCSLIFGY